MDAAFVSQYQSKLDAIDNLEHKAILTALLKTDFPTCYDTLKLYLLEGVSTRFPRETILQLF